MIQVIDAIAARGPGVSLRTAVVTAIGDTCTITLAGATLSGIPRLASYSPAVDDVVLVLQMGAQLVIIGKAGGTGAAGATGATGPGVATGGTAAQVLAKIDGTDYHTHWVAAAGSLSARTTASLTTSSLATNASADVTVSLPAGYRLYSISTDRPARVELYSTSAKRTADASRAVGTAPAGDHGVMLDFVTTGSVLSADLSPLVDGFDGAGTPAGAIAGRVVNLHTSTTTITVTFAYVRTE